VSLFAAAVERVLRSNTTELASSPLGKIAVEVGAGLVRRFVPPVDELINAQLAQFPFAKGVIDQGAIAFSVEQFNATPNPLLGGITPIEARMIAEDLTSRELSRKNLFLLEVVSNLLGSGAGQTFNLFATGVEYSPYTLSGEKRRIGGASNDTLQAGDPVEMRITTYDDKAGSIKGFFAQHAQKAVRQDGTVTPPSYYALKIKVIHGIISQNYNFGSYEQSGWFRPANIEHSLSRTEQGMEEVTMTFTQLDSFM
jgi:hypothetical protein